MNVEEQIKRIEFNKTDGKVLIKLIEDAKDKGSLVRKTSRKIKEKAIKILKELSQIEKIIYTEHDLSSKERFLDCCAVGIDGSFHTVGSLSSKYYAPFSVVRIIFERGISDKPEIHVYAAGIEEIDENEHKSVDAEASRRMLLGETKALYDWNSENIKSLVFIDGPVVDPPGYVDESYVDYRCDAIKISDNSLMIGCVKRCIDSHFLRYYEKILKLRKGDLMKHFSVDKNLFAYFFTKYRFDNNYNGVLFTHPLELRDEVSRKYSNYGVRIFSVFFQKDSSSNIIRLDVPMAYGDAFEEKIFNAIRATCEWTFPGQDIPVPIEIAHEKCKIRGGAAQVIYEEILARAHASDIEDMVIMRNLG